MVGFDIFRMSRDGNLSWIEMAPTQKVARQLVQRYVDRFPAVYFILSHPGEDLEIIDAVESPKIPYSPASTTWTN
jgi:hypothetical protein